MKLDLHSLPLVYRSALLRLEFSQKDALSALASSAVVVADLFPSRPVVVYYGDALPNVDSLSDKSALHLVVMDSEAKPAKHAKGICPACFSFVVDGRSCPSCASKYGSQPAIPPAPSAMGWGGAYAQPVPSASVDEVVIPPDVFARVKDVVFLNGRDDTNDGLHNHLHRVASDAVRDALADEDIDPDLVNASQLEELAIEYKGGFWDLCHQDERARGAAALAFLAELLECGTLDPLDEGNPTLHAGIAALVAGNPSPVGNGIKALGVLGRLHDGLSDMIEGGRLKEADIPDDYQWLVSMLVNESLPLFAEDTRGHGAPVPAPAAVGSPDVVGEHLGDIKTTRVPVRAIAEYNVWICIEAVDSEGDAVGNDIDPGFGSCVSFETLGEATMYAQDLFAYSQGSDSRASLDTLKTIASYPANSNSDPDVMGEALDRIIAMAAHAVGGVKSPDWHEVRRALVLSSMHVRTETFMHYNETPPADRVFRVWDFDSGWCCKLPASDEDGYGELPEDLLAVFKHARSMGLTDYDLIVFDCDGGQVPELPTYEDING